MARLPEQKQRDQLFEARLERASKRLTSAVEGLESQLTRGRNQLQHFQLLRRLWMFGKYLPGAFTVGVSLLKLARQGPIISVAATVLAGVWLSRWIRTSQSPNIRLDTKK
jgi:hypothetical protein